MKTYFKNYKSSKSWEKLGRKGRRRLAVPLTSKWSWSPDSSGLMRFGLKQLASQAWEVAQSVSCLPCEHKDLTGTPQDPIKTKQTTGRTCEGERMVLGARWPTSLPCAPPVRDLSSCSEKVMQPRLVSPVTFLLGPHKC